MNLKENMMRNCKGEGIKKLESFAIRVKDLAGGGGVIPLEVTEYPENFGMLYPLLFLPLIPETQVENVMLTKRGEIDGL